MGAKPQQSTTKEELPPYVQDAQKHLIATGQRLTDPFLQYAPAYATAGFNPDQMMGFDLSRGMAETAFSTPTPWLSGSAAQATGAYMPPAALSGGAASSAAQVTPGEISQFLNPYTGAVVDTTLNTMRREYDRNNAGIGARAAAAGAFGGSGAAIERAQLARSFGDQVASTTAQLMAAGYDKATATAMANAQMRQQTEMSNAQLAQNNGQFNASAQNAMGLQGAQMAQQNNQFNAGAQNSMAVQSAQTNSAMLNDEQTRQMRAIQQLLQGGQTQQGVAQQSIDVPWTMLQRLIGTTPSLNNTGGTKTTETSGGGPGAAQLGLGLLGMFLSDEDTKKDVEKLGKDPKTGLPLYSYNYKSDPPSAPKRVGPMAQDIEKKYPGMVRTVGGKKVVG